VKKTVQDNPKVISKFGLVMLLYGITELLFCIIRDEKGLSILFGVILIYVGSLIYVMSDSRKEIKDE
jgi:hypothetical protein